MTNSFRQLPHVQHSHTQPQQGSLLALALLLSYAMFPRLWIIGFWIFGGMLGDAYSHWALPAIGFLVAPWTTLLYAWMWAIGSTSVTGWEWLPVAFGLVLDASLLWVAARLFR